MKERHHQKPQPPPTTTKTPPRPGAHPAPAPVVSILLSPGFGHLSPPMRITTQRATTHSPQPDHHGPPHEDSPPPPLFLSACARMLAHHESTLTPNPSLARHAAAKQPSATLYGAGQRLSRPITVNPAPKGASHTPTSPHQRREHQPSKPGQRGGRSHTVPPPQASAPTPRSANTHTNTPHAQTPNPSHPQANTPTTSPNKARPQANTKSAHARARGQARCVSAGGPACPGRGDRHEAKQAKPPQGRARRTSAHKASAQTMGFAPKRCRPAPARRGVRRERKAAHNSPRQSALVVVFVGVFADVCRRFWAGWFGGLGVFWGCLACFLVF